MPEITNFTVIASLVLTLDVLIDEVILNSPTPPEKLVGLLGRGCTSIICLGVNNDFFTSIIFPQPLNYASKGSID